VDETAVLAGLALVTALNTVVILVLAIATIRSQPGARGTDVSVQSIVSVLEPVADATASADPLAGAISAFLTRPDGLFRAGAPASLAPSSSVAPSSTGASPASVVQPQSPVPPAPPAPAWAPSRPVRYVASAPRPMGRPSFAEPAPAAPSGPTVVRPRPLAPTRSPAATAVVAPRASLVSVWFVGRDASRSIVQPGAVARLGPVIGGLLRERTRAEDSVAVEAAGRFAVTLLDTPVDGAAALTRRLALGCDAWLAAEEPPLRLEFGVSELALAARSLSERPDRGSGPERRRAVPLDI
jgi:hypothetical protein